MTQLKRGPLSFALLEWKKERPAVISGPFMLISEGPTGVRRSVSALKLLDEFSIPVKDVDLQGHVAGQTVGSAGVTGIVGSETHLRQS